jgi:hypothetical protein
MHELAARDPVRSRRYDPGCVGRAQSQWKRTIAAFADQLGPIEATVLAAAIEAASTELWADLARHKYWRHRPGAARRRIVATAFAALAAASHPVPTEAIGDALADAYNALHDEELSLFPDAHETLDRPIGRGAEAIEAHGGNPLERSDLAFGVLLIRQPATKHEIQDRSAQSHSCSNSKPRVWFAIATTSLDETTRCDQAEVATVTAASACLSRSRALRFDLR